MRIWLEFDITTLLSQRYSQVSWVELNCCGLFAANLWRQHSLRICIRRKYEPGFTLHVHAYYQHIFEEIWLNQTFSFVFFSIELLNTGWCQRRCFLLSVLLTWRAEHEHVKPNTGRIVDTTKYRIKGESHKFVSSVEGHDLIFPGLFLCPVL